MPDLFVMKKGHDEINLTARLPAVDLLEVNTGAPQLNPTYTGIAGSDGQLLQSVAFNSSTFTVSLLIKGNNRSDFNLIKAELQKELYARVPIRLRSSFEPAKAVWVVANPTDITPLANSDTGTVNLAFTVISGLRMTPFRSDELADNQELLSVGMGFPDMDNLPNYHFTSEEFDVFNPSDIEIDPYIQHHDLVIKLSGNTSGFKVENQTNGTSFTVNGQVNKDDKLVMDGITLFKNGEAGNVLTDFGHLVLAKGNNHIKLTGLADSDVTFSFPFLYF
ncbi:hypothetical protein R54839_PPFHFPJH_00182 [Fructobacillus fructosus]|uniref:Siphovirus-type tail component RIFT-related domain-containing protein n=1 Tax=Fructobacillus fructosus TaxID=1631 RepID=A0ABN9YIN7_9LACO|nr:hypothetical protein R54839_PPFHFPJH_00182 [Fructobacillus fructosus]